MPLYDYTCTTCGHSETQSNSMANRHKPSEYPCPNCGLIGTFHLQIKEAPTLGYSMKTPSMVTDTDFNSRMKDIHKAKGRHSNMSDAIK